MQTRPRVPGSGWGIYMSIGAGLLKGKFPVDRVKARAALDAAGKQKFDANYNLADLGFTYTFEVAARWCEKHR